MLIQWQSDGTLVISELALAILEAMDDELSSFRSCPSHWAATLDADPQGVIVRIERKAKRERKRIRQGMAVVACQ